MNKKLLKNVAVAVFGLVIAVAVIEAFFFAAPNFLPKNIRFVATSVFDDELRQVFKPNTDTIQVLEDGVVWRLKTTDLGLGKFGFRDDGIDGEVYAVVVGDSHVYGHGVNLENVWTEILEKNVGKEIANMGQPSAFPETQEKILERYDAEFKPKLIIFTLFQNDWVDAAAFENEKTGFTNVKRVMDSYSSTYRLARFVVNIQQYQISDTYQRYSDGKVEMFLYPLHMGPSVDDSDPSLVFGKESMMASMASAAELAGESGAEIIFVVFPSKEQVYWDEVREYAPDPDVDIDAMNNFVASICVENNFNCLDLTPTFRQNKNVQMFFPMDGHPNENGHRIVAGAVQNYLSENNFLN